MKQLVRYIREDKYKRGLFILIIVHSFLFILYQTLNKTVQTWDSAGHIGTSMLMADQIKNFLTGTNNVSIFDILTVSNYYPPFVQTLGAVINLIFGYHSDLLVYVGLIFFIISMIFLYKVVLLISNDPKTALLSTVIYSLFPQVADQARLFHLDIPLIAFLLISYYSLMKSKGFSNTKYSLIFFIFLGLAQLTKWYAFIFLLVPLTYVIYKYFLTKQESLLEKRGRIINFLAGIILLVLVASPWYLANLRDFIELATIFAKGEIDDPKNLLSLENLVYYPYRILVYQILLFPFILIILSLRRLYIQNKSNGLYYLVLILLPILVFTFIGNKNLRYVLPLTPFFAYLIADYVLKASLRWRYLTHALLSYAIAGFLFSSFNQVESETQLLKPVGVVLAGPGYRDWYHNPGFYSYESDYWPVRDVLNFVVEDANYPEDRGLGITPLIDTDNFSLASIEMLRRESLYNNVYIPVPYFQFEPFESDEAILAYFEENGVDYVLVPQNPGPSGLRNYAVLVQMIEYLTSKRNYVFAPVKRFELPDNTALVVYKRVVGSDGDVIDLPTNECTSSAGFQDGIESVKLKPNHTYMIFTGHFAIQDVVDMQFSGGVLYVVQIENTIHESILDIHNLPTNGATLCSREGLGLDIIEEIKKPLVEKGHCGVDCEKVIHVKWSVGDESVEVNEYDRGGFKVLTL